MSESAYNSPLLTRRLTDSCCSSPARSIRSNHPEDLTDSDGEADQHCITEVPGTPDQTVISGWLKFRDNKKVFLYLEIKNIVKRFSIKTKFWNIRSS